MRGSSIRPSKPRKLPVCMPHLVHPNSAPSSEFEAGLANRDPAPTCRYALRVRILRLSNSDDMREAPDVPRRAYRIVEAALTAETGEPVETIVRDAWPEPNLPDVVDGWLKRYEPDIVFLKVSSYWFTYRSTPLKFQ